MKKFDVFIKNNIVVGIEKESDFYTINYENLKEHNYSCIAYNINATDEKSAIAKSNKFMIRKTHELDEGNLSYLSSLSKWMLFYSICSTIFR